MKKKNKIKIKINGRLINIKTSTTLKDLLLTKKIPINKVAIELNNKIVNIPSYCLKTGDVIEVRKKSKKMDTILESMRRIKGDMDLTWLGLDKAKMRGTFHSVPDRDEMQLTANEQLVVELYSK